MRCRMRQRRGTLEAAAEDRLEAAARRLVLGHSTANLAGPAYWSRAEAFEDLAFAIGELDVVRDLRRIAGRPSAQGRRMPHGRRVAR